MLTSKTDCAFTVMSPVDAINPFVFDDSVDATKSAASAVVTSVDTVSPDFLQAPTASNKIKIGVLNFFMVFNI